MTLTSPPAPSANFRLRLAQPSDLDALLELETATFTSDLLSRRRMRHWIGAGNGIFIVAVAESGILAGYCLAFTRRDSDGARAYSIAIAPFARGKGLGTRLFRELEMRCRKAGFSRLLLEVAHDNQVAIALYEKLGYQKVRSIPEFYEDGKDAWRMEKALS
jgi:ribosomal protein S18 acetylase RimI-like enzyme